MQSHDFITERPALPPMALTLNVVTRRPLYFQLYSIPVLPYLTYLHTPDILYLMRTEIIRMCLKNIKCLVVSYSTGIENWHFSFLKDIFAKWSLCHRRTRVAACCHSKHGTCWLGRKDTNWKTTPVIKESQKFALQLSHLIASKNQTALCSNDIAL